MLPSVSLHSSYDSFNNCQMCPLIFYLCYYEQKIVLYFQLCSMKANKRTTKIVFYTSLKDNTWQNRKKNAKE